MIPGTHAGTYVQLRPCKFFSLVTISKITQLSFSHSLLMLIRMLVRHVMWFDSQKQHGNCHKHGLQKAQALPDGMKAACCWNCMFARACWYWNTPALNIVVAPLAFSSAGLFGKGGKTGGSPWWGDDTKIRGWEWGESKDCGSDDQDREKREFH